MIHIWFLRVPFVVLLLTVMGGVPIDSQETQGNRFKQNATLDAVKRVDRVNKETRENSRRSNTNTSSAPSHLLTFFKQFTAKNKIEVQNAENVEISLRPKQHWVHVHSQWEINITDRLTVSELGRMIHAAKSSRVVQPSVCETDCWSNRYRAINSMCNNRRTPYLGIPNMPFTRWLPAEYEDGFSLPKGWIQGKLYLGFPLPPVREVSNKILKASIENIVSDSERSRLFAQWGQWISHDISLTQPSNNIQAFSNGINCATSCVQKAPCFPIKVTCGDLQATDTRQCLPFTRSALTCRLGFGNRNGCEQINEQTAYIDACNVYGSTENQAKKLRNFTNDLGLLKVNPTFSDHNLQYLPFRNVSQTNVCPMAYNKSLCPSINIPCMQAGDGRANENLGLLAFHTIFLREHNRLARELKRLNPHWSGETIYQEARKIIGAHHQIITYRDYIPRVIGKHATRKYLSEYQGYNESADPRLSNVFATAAMRFGHVTVQPVVKRFNEMYQEDPKYPSKFLHNTYFTPRNLIEEGGIDPIIRGLFGYPAKLQTQDAMMTDELREKLVISEHQMNLDLSAINIQRSRDHGLQGYNAWRKFCGLSEPRGLFDLSFILKNMELASNLLELYGTPENIDVWVGGISEPFVEGGRVGPLFGCLIGRQFKNLRDGDRFWWKNKGVFTAKQQQALQQVSFSAFICDNTRIENVPRDVLTFRPYPEAFVRCDHIPRVDLSAWREMVDGTSCGAIPLVSHAHFSVCKSLVTYTCRSGFELVGGDTIKCLRNGLWHSAPPTCTELPGNLDKIQKEDENELDSTELDQVTDFADGSGDSHWAAV
ncbi:eosinophil peroxidase-like isoform X2 [Leucoraja erinacea]|nr:eosinophil peroxidase-like isoform X2 [Leucoraja erinacea]